MADNTTGSGGGTSCSIDFRDNATVAAGYANQCVAAGGQYYTENFTAACTLSSNRAVKVTFLDQPFCLGAACTPADTAEYFTGVTLAVQGRQCDSGSTPTSAAAAGSATGAAAVAFWAAVALAVLSLGM